MDEPLPARTWADVSLGALARNFRRLRERVPDGDAVAAVVKADGYGHGLVPVARVCAAAGARHFATATLDEAIALRRSGIPHAILVLAPLLPEEAEPAARHDIVPFVSSRLFLDALAEVARHAPLPLSCFLAVDTGMGREGLDQDEAVALFRAMPDGVAVAGIATHFSSADDDPDHTRAQSDAFDRVLARMGSAADGLWRSVANSPGMLRAPRPAGGPVLWRPGALLYGISPYPGAADLAGTLPALAWRARVTLVREHPAGAAIGYGRTAVLERPSRIATLAAGYADGLSRRLSNRGEVLIHGHRCPLIGRVSMDQCQADVTDAPPVAIGDVATLLGPDGGDAIPAEEMAGWIGTTVHEPTTVLTGRVARRYHP